MSEPQQPIGQNGSMVAYLTDDPAVARVVNTRTKQEDTCPIDRLVKFGWTITLPT